MRDLFDVTGEEALDLLADAVEPLSVIFKDKELMKAVGNPKISTLEKVQMLIRAHKAEVFQLMALIDGEDVKDYKPNVFTLPIRLNQLVSDERIVEALSQVFPSSPQKEVSGSSGDVTENTEGEGK